MRNSRGFMLLELMVVFCLCSVLLLGIVQGFGSCLRTRQRTAEAWQAYLLAQGFLAGKNVTLPAGWELITQKENFKNVLLINVQVRVGERVIANVVQVQQ